MQLGRTFGHRIASDLDAFFDRVRICIFLPSPSIKSAKLAVCHTDVCVVKMPVDVVIGRQAMLPPPDRIGQLPERIQVRGVEKRQAVLERQPIAVLDLKAYVDQFRVK